MANRKKCINQDNNCDTLKKNSMRKIRIIYSDPYATESSSDDEEKNEFKPMGGKRNVKEILIPDENSLLTDVNAMSKECKDLFSHPSSPSSVLEVSTPALLGNGIGNSIKEEDNVEPILYSSTSALVGNRVGNSNKEEGSVDPNLKEEQSFLDFVDDIDAYPTLGDECGEEYALPPFNIEFAVGDFSWIDEVLDLSGL